jgi:hypothetical protein
MGYITQGTVQVELKPQSETAIEVRINPVQEFAVKYRQKDKDRDTDYIIFISDDLPTPSARAEPLDARAVQKAHTFSAPLTLERALTDAALKSIKLEIKVDFYAVHTNTASTCGKREPPDKSEPLGNIVSIKIPATPPTPRADTV